MKRAMCGTFGYAEIRHANAKYETESVASYPAELLNKERLLPTNQSCGSITEAESPLWHPREISLALFVSARGLPLRVYEYEFISAEFSEVNSLWICVLVWLFE